MHSIGRRKRHEAIREKEVEWDLFSSCAEAPLLASGKGAVTFVEDRGDGGANYRGLVLITSIKLDGCSRCELNVRRRLRCCLNFPAGDTRSRNNSVRCWPENSPVEKSSRGIQRKYE